MTSPKCRSNTDDLEPVSSGGNQRCCVRLPVETVMRTASTVRFPESVFKAQGLKQEAYAHPRDVKTGGCFLVAAVFSAGSTFTSDVSIVSNVRLKSTEIIEYKWLIVDMCQTGPNSISIWIKVL